MNYPSLGAMFQAVCEKYPEKTGMMYKTGGKYQSLAFKEIQEKEIGLAAGLKKLGVEKGDRVLLLSENRVEWALSDYAILSLGGITVPIYPTLLPSHIEFIINNSEGQIIIISGTHQLAKLRKIQKKLKNLKHIILMDGEKDKDIITWDEIYESGKSYREKYPDFQDKTLAGLNRDDVASIIYTSGTTGTPKGVMLVHGNFLSNVEGSLQVLPVDSTDTFLSFLPLSHVFERMAGHFLAFSIGATIAYAESIDTVAENLNEVHPTIMTSVPRFFEKVYARVLESLEEGSAVKRKIFFWAIELGKKAILYKQKKMPLSGLIKIQYGIADKLVYSKLKERVGGKIRMFISGGAPLSRDINEFFNAAGLVLLEGFGLTESSPVISVNRLDNFKFGSVGLPIPNVEVCIEEDGEILTRGPHVMKGYYKNEEETKESIDKDGWLHTGDIGYLDKDGFLFITDRKKNIIVTSGGKNVAPQSIENLLITSKYIEQAVVVGNRRKYCSALIVPAMESVEAYAKKNNIQYSNIEELVEKPEINDLIRKEIDAVSTDLASYETIKKFKLMSEPFTIESGDLTPTLKIKRNVVEKKYEHLIDQLYPHEDYEMKEDG
ncbi:MAG: long-chain fatty acid--CoA ligase [Calditrichia bacterium]